MAGRAVNRQRDRQGLSRAWELAVLSMLVVFYLANIYDRGISDLLYYVKWAMMLPVIALSWRASRQAPPAPASVPPMPFVALSLALLPSLLDSQDIEVSGANYVSLVLALVTAFSLSDAVVRADSVRQFFDLFAKVGRLVIASAAVMWMLDLNLGRGGGDRFTAWTDNPNTLALMIAPTLIVLIGDALSRRRGWLLWSLPFLAVGTFLLVKTGSRASLLWLLMGALGYYAYYKGLGFSFFFGLFGLLLGMLLWDAIEGMVYGIVRREAVTSDADVLSGRSEYWTLGAELFSDRPLLGYGYGMSQTLLEGYKWMFREAQGLHFHNSYLSAAVETGLVGLIALTILLLMAILVGARSLRLTRRQALPDWPAGALPWVVTIGALSHAFFESWLLAAGNANMVFLWTCIGILLRRANRSNRATVTHRVGRLINA